MIFCRFRFFWGLILVFFMSVQGLAAEPVADPGVPVRSTDLTTEVLRETRFRQKAMLTLGGWSLSNLALSGIQIGSSQGDARHYWQMTGYWNVVNLGIAGLGYLGALQLREEAHSGAALLQEQQKLRGLLLLNTGLDVAYMAAGWAMLERGLRRPGPDGARWRGFGRAVATQGAFLLVFDAALLLLQPGRGTFKSEARWQVQPSLWLGAAGSPPVWGVSFRKE